MFFNYHFLAPFLISLSVHSFSVIPSSIMDLREIFKLIFFIVYNSFKDLDSDLERVPKFVRMLTSMQRKTLFIHPRFI